MKRFGLAFVRWFDSWAGVDESADQVHGVDWTRVLPFLAMHLACLAVLWVGVSPVAVAVAVAGYFLRMFAITAFYHRYFSHRSFRTSRVVQFLGGFLGAADRDPPTRDPRWQLGWHQSWRWRRWPDRWRRNNRFR